MSRYEENLAKSAEYLSDVRKEPLPHFLNGHPVTTAETFENFTPHDGSLLNTVCRGNEDIVNAAALASKEAFEGWKLVDGDRRRQVLHMIADKIIERADEIALLDSIDAGQPIRYMLKAAQRGAENFRYFADRAPDSANGVTVPRSTHLNYSTRQPIGPVGIITPWNTPFMQSTWKIAPALAAGCTVVHKPAEWSPITANILAEITQDVCERADVQGGILNVVHGFGEEAGRSLTMHRDIKAIGFVGESATGSKIMAQGSETLKRVHFELGGKNPVIVFDDADLEKALDAVMFMIFSMNGERCTSSSRALIQSSIYEEFLDRLKLRIEKLKIGHPLDPRTEIGPLIHARHHKKVTDYFRIAREEGVDIRTGGESCQMNGGFHVQPTLFANVNMTMRVAREEIFGPVLSTIAFEGEADAVQIANDIDYGLAGYIWTRNIGRAHRIAERLEAGMIWINSENYRHLTIPFGGMKASGIGRDGGDYSFDLYTETKNIAVALDRHVIPRIGV